ncbi:Pkinase-domain-containing protein [Metschnikowia bicuspidata var. bicuspidata NRRL YB-4993]|uniref:Pkinase-domain-containing protein n=1 Tax=Metschnikowia bicuspidata var. bicuspidata NRRL YB-4993 TaxID=869754 RepID=A0A1A0H5Y9_9ASCO|nr:Pkinase-domain-containing protein [Metschnikowia bicuspidata var. bicuspidata NRRL YB-4993]OBA19322.1 Pkinase-domain-containing protein [Metschnikowia bicuspidata var. bicuspidata NRRL YB-4993]
MSLTRKRQLLEVQSLPKRQLHKYEPVAKLFSVKPDQPHLLIPKIPRGIVVGRSSSCDIKITGGDVSSKHCQFSLSSTNGQEFLLVTDTSTNGTFVNGELLGKGISALLRSGDKISFARSSTYIFRYVGDELGNAKKSFFDDYILQNQLGTGHYAVVREARDRTTGDIVAVKIFHPNKTKSGGINPDGGEEAKLRQEMNLLLSTNHPNIVRFISHYVEPINEFSSTTYLVLEKVNSGELFQRIINKLKLRQDETKAIYNQLLSGLHYLHGKNIIHRDIKPENILLDITPRSASNSNQTGPWDDDEYDVRVKIADFGLAKFIGELKFTNTLCGTPAYVAPEVLNNNQNYTTKVDIWLAGVLLYVCLCGFPPFSDELGPPSMREQILGGKFAFYSPYWDDIKDSALDLISNLLLVDPLQRYDISQSCQHFWFSENDDDIKHSFSSSMSNNSLQPVTSATAPITLKQRFTSELNFGN